MLLSTASAATKSSFFDTAAALSRDGYRVHALDFPGFGGSSQARDRAVHRPLVRRDRRRRHGRAGHRPRPPRRQLDGRPRRARGRPARPRARPRRSALLCPAVAFIKRGFHPIVRLAAARARPAAPPLHAAGWSPASSGRMFGDPDAVDPAVADVAVDEFQRIYASAGARFAFLSAARNIYLDKPFGRGGFYPRLAELEAARAVRLGHPRPADPRRASSATSPAGCPRPSRSSSRAAATCPRSSAPSRPTGCSRGSSRAPTRSGRPARAARASPRRLGGMAEAPTAAHDHARNGHSAQRPRRRGARRDGRAPRAGAGGGLAGMAHQALGALAGAVSSRIPRRRPRRARPRLHPRAPPRPVAAVEPVLPRRGPRPGQHPRGRARSCWSATTPAATSRPTPTSSRWPSAPTSASSARFYQLAHNLVLSMPGLGMLRKFGTVAASPENTRKALDVRRGAARLPRRRLRGPPAVAGSATASTSTAARASSARRCATTSRSSRSSRSAARRPRCSSRAASGSPGCWCSTSSSA